jgi:hypothetical protein
MLIRRESNHLVGCVAGGTVGSAQIRIGITIYRYL